VVVVGTTVVVGATVVALDAAIGAASEGFEQAAPSARTANNQRRITG
jgi:hypothetical protein